MNRGVKANARIDRTRDVMQDMATILGFKILKKWALHGWAPEVTDAHKIEHARRFGVTV